MKIQITGASGFVGQNLLQYLNKYDLQSLTVRYQAGQKIRLHSDVIIHLAGKAHDLKKTAQPSAYYEANYELTRQLYDAFLQSDASKFIFISSVKAAADAIEGVLTEETIPKPETHYGQSKLMAEEYIQSKPLPTGKAYYILRPCMIHGPGNKGNLNLLYQFVKREIPYPLATFENKRSFLSVENLCFVINELIKQDIPSGIYQLADDESLSTNELVKEIALARGTRAKLWAIPAGLIKLLAKAGDVLRLPLNSERLQKLTESYVVSNYKIKQALAKELPVSARKGLQKTIQSF